MEFTDHRPIRSFVLRQGRTTAAQNAALETLWPTYGLDPESVLDPSVAFGRDAPVVLEIGFGNGDSLAAMAAAAPEMDFVGIEVHRPGVGHLLLKIRELELSNLRLYHADAIFVLRNVIADRSLDRIQVYFPDPWPKKRHHKRRLVNPGFVALATAKLKPGGILHCATDWEQYAEQMLQVLEENPGLSNRAGEGAFSERPPYRPLTKFELRGQRLGHGVWDVVFEKL